jgi:hypothetical protein
VDLAARHDGNAIVEQIGERAQDAALRLAAEAEQNEIVSGQNGVDELRDHRLVVADDPGEEALARLQLAHQIVANFLLDRSRAIVRPTKLAEGGDARHGSILSELT